METKTSLKKIIIDGKEISIKETSDFSTTIGRIVSYAKELGYFEPEALRIAKKACDEDVDLFDISFETPGYGKYLLETYLKKAKTDLVLSSATIAEEYKSLKAGVISNKRYEATLTACKWLTGSGWETSGETLESWDVTDLDWWKKAIEKESADLFDYIEPGDEEPDTQYTVSLIEFDKNDPLDEGKVIAWFSVWGSELKAFRNA